MTVLPAYALHMVPDPEPELLAICSPEQVDLLRLQVEQRRAAARDSWYPCRDCNRRAFFRWAEGHWNKDHDLAGCADCIDMLGGTRAARRAARAQHTVPDAPDRRDLA